MKLWAEVMEEIGRKVEDVASEGSWASEWKGLTSKGRELGCPTLSIPSGKGNGLAFGWPVIGQPAAHPHMVSGLISEVSSNR